MLENVIETIGDLEKTSVYTEHIRLHSISFSAVAMATLL